MAKTKAPKDGKVAGDRRIARQGADDQQVSRPQLYGRGQHRPRPRSCRREPSRSRPEFKGEDWAHLGVNVNHDFDPVYIIPPGKTAQVRKLKGLLKDASDLYLATDEDREGEAISWHLHELLKPKVPVHRLVFHEITKEAIRRSARASARDRRRPGRGPRSPADRRPAVRLRGFAAAVAQGAAAAVGRPGAERGRAADRRARAAADGFRLGHLLGPAGHVRQVERRTVPGRAGLGRRPQDSRRQGFRSGHRQAQGRQPAVAR